MILAGIDIGTNTFRLLIADVTSSSFHELAAHRRSTRLGQDLHQRGVLARPARDRAVAALREFAALIDQQGLIPTVAVGTSALRIASNAAEFVDEARRETGIEINVIAGEEEARLTLLGVQQVVREITTVDDQSRSHSLLVIDVGGGSTELISSTDGAQSLALSIPLGAVYLTEQYLRHDPPTPAEIESLRSGISRTLDDHVRRAPGIVPAPPPKLLVGTAGAITSLAAMDQGLAVYDPSKINGYRLSREATRRLTRKLAASTLRERGLMAGLESGREDIIVAGALIALAVMDRYAYQDMIVSDGGLREGIILDLHNRLRGADDAAGREQREDHAGRTHTHHG